MGVKVLTVKETAALLKTSKQQIRKMIREEALPAVKVGREWRINEEYLEEFLAQPFNGG
ncbi:MAG: helix-turn-helix domain-containing protein [Ruminococcaceae bacterium]|nr:helix-turn-helix domain-containing protein [Oscillospiraceae bacterium]